MKIGRLDVGAIAICCLVLFYVFNRSDGFSEDFVYNRALEEAGGDPLEALKRLGPAYIDPQGNLIHLTLQRSIRRQGRAASLPDYQLNNSVLARVNKVESIKHLAVGHPTLINAAGIKHIAKMSNLETLSLKFTQLGNASLIELLPLKKLRVLYVDGTNLTASDARTFERSMPNCEVVLWPEEASRPSEVRAQLQTQLIDDVQAARLISFSIVRNSQSLPNGKQQ